MSKQNSRGTKRGQASDSVVNRLAKMPFMTKLICIAIILILLAFAFPLVCQFSGKTLGSAVGVAVGSYKAVTEEIPTAYNDGKGDGLSAEDISVKIVDKAKEVGKLDVLVANMRIVDNFKEGTAYQAILSTDAKVVFSVDLSQLSPTMNVNEKRVNVTLPGIESTLYIDDTSTEKLTEAKATLFDGSAKDGVTAYLNYSRNLEDKAFEQINNYDKYLEQAQKAAVEQISRIVQNIVGTDYSVGVYFENSGR